MKNVKKQRKLNVKKIAVFASSAVLSAVLSVFAISAAITNYDPATDPLVTKSYVESYVTSRIADVTGVSSETVGKQIDEKIASMNIADTVKNEVLEEIGESGVEADIAYKLVSLKKGQRLIGVGCTELILRDGDATAITVDDGLSDVTKGVDLTSGEAIAKNHYLLIPVDDGRGILVTSDSAKVLVRGDYEIR